VETEVTSTAAAGVTDAPVFSGDGPLYNDMHLYLPYKPGEKPRSGGCKLHYVPKGLKTVYVAELNCTITSHTVSVGDCEIPKMKLERIPSCGKSDNAEKLFGKLKVLHLIPACHRADETPELANVHLVRQSFIYRTLRKYNAAIPETRLTKFLTNDGTGVTTPAIWVEDIHDFAARSGYEVAALQYDEDASPNYNPLLGNAPQLDWPHFWNTFLVSLSLGGGERDRHFFRVKESSDKNAFWLSKAGKYYTSIYDFGSDIIVDFEDDFLLLHVMMEDEGLVGYEPWNGYFGTLPLDAQWIAISLFQVRRFQPSLKVGCSKGDSALDTCDNDLLDGISQYKKQANLSTRKRFIDDAGPALSATHGVQLDNQAKEVGKRLLTLLFDEFSTGNFRKPIVIANSAGYDEQGNTICSLRRGAIVSRFPGVDAIGSRVRVYVDFDKIDPTDVASESCEAWQDDVPIWIDKSAVYDATHKEF